MLLVCACWGTTFLVMEMALDRARTVLETTSRWSPAALFLLARFALAAAATPLLIPQARRHLDVTAWRYGFWLSVPVSAGFILQVFGLSQDDVTPSLSAFLTSLFAVVTPLLDGVVRRRVPGRRVLLGVLLAAPGAAFIQGPPQGGLSLGAWCTVLGAVAFGGHILVTDHATRRADPMALTLTTLTISSGWLALSFLLAPGSSALLTSRGLGLLVRDATFSGAVVYTALVASVLVLALLNRWQKEMSPSRAAIVYTTEPIFATLVSIAAGRDRVSGWLLLGATAILAANLVVARAGQGASPPSIPAHREPSG